MIPPDASDDDFCYLTTRGRVTGEPHEIEIWFAVHGQTLFMLAGGRERSDWVRNLQAHPDVTIRIRDVTYECSARVISDPTEEHTARDALFDKYEPRSPGLARWREVALPVAFDVR